jgi:hypothetical protein
MQKFTWMQLKKSGLQQNLKMIRSRCLERLGTGCPSLKDFKRFKYLEHL